MADSQRFGEGDIVMTHDGFRCKVKMPIQDENGEWFYEVEPVDFKAFPREIPQGLLKDIGQL